MLIPRMIDDSLRLTIDDVFEPKYVNNDPNNYKSPFSVEGYEDTENMYQYLLTLCPNEAPVGPNNYNNNNYNISNVGSNANNK